MAAAPAHLSRPVLIFLVVAAAVTAAFGTWWFAFRNGAVDVAEVLHRPETLDAGVLRDARYAALRAPAAVQPTLRLGRPNPFEPPGPGAPQTASSSPAAPTTP